MKPNKESHKNKKSNVQEEKTEEENSEESYSPSPIHIKEKKRNRQSTKAKQSNSPFPYDKKANIVSTAPKSTKVNATSKVSNQKPPSKKRKTFTEHEDVFDFND